MRIVHNSQFETIPLVVMDSSRPGIISYWANYVQASMKLTSSKNLNSEAALLFYDCLGINLVPLIYPYLTITETPINFSFHTTIQTQRAERIVRNGI